MGEGFKNFSVLKDSFIFFWGVLQKVPPSASRRVLVRAPLDSFGKLERTFIQRAARQILKRTLSSVAKFYIAVMLYFF